MHPPENAEGIRPWGQMPEICGGPGQNRTAGHPLRRRMLYPAELQNHRQPFVAFFCQPRQDLQAPFAKIAPRTAGHAQAGRQKLSVQLCSAI